MVQRSFRVSLAAVVPALVWAVVVPPVSAEILPAQVLVVLNSRSAGAAAVGDAYLAAHPGIPAANVFDLDDPLLADRADISYADFVSRIRNPIRAYLSASGDPAPEDIVSIVLIRGIPHRIGDTDEFTAGDYPATLSNEFSAGDATAASVDAELVLLWQDLDAGEAGRTMDSKSDNQIDNPYHGSRSDIQSFSRSRIMDPKSFSNYGNAGVAWSLSGSSVSRLTPGDLYLVCRIDASTVEDAVAMIRRASHITIDRARARVVLDKDGRANALDDDGLFGSAPLFNAGPDYENARDALQAAGWQVDYDATAAFFTAADQAAPLIAYAGYGENHQPSPAGAGSYIDGVRFTPGAIFNTYESFNGRAFNGLSTRFSQEQVADFIAAGGTFGIGHVWEPFSFSIPDNEFLLTNFLINGLSWGESAYTAIPGLSWMHVVIGDPLAEVEKIVDARQPGDFDADTDVDGDDVAFFESCATGPAIPVVGADCQAADFDRDGDVDQADYGRLQRCWSGADVEADPDCLE